MATLASNSLDSFEQSIGAKSPIDLDEFEQSVGAQPSAGADLDSFEQQVGAVSSDISPDYQNVQKTINRSFWDAPIVGTEETADKELEAIAQHHQVDPEALKQASTFMGAHREAGKSEVGGELESALGRGVGGGLPQFLAKKAVDDPNFRNALDDVRELSNQKRSFAQGLAENLIPVGAGAKVVKGGIQAAEKGITRALGTAAIKGAPVGAAYGLGGSREGEELESAKEGALVGAGLGTGAEALGRVVAKLGKVPAAEQELAGRMIQRDAPNLDEGTERILTSRKESEQDIQEIFEGKKTLDDAAAKRIVEQHLDPETLEKYRSPSTEEGQIIREKVGNSPQDLERQLAQDIVERRARDFAEELTGDRPKTLEEARSAIQEHASRQGQEATENRYKLFQQEQAAKDYIAAESVRGGRDENFGNKALNFISDAQFVLRDIDQKMGTSTEAVHRQLNSDYNRMSFARQEIRGQLNDIFHANKAVDPVITDSDKIYQALDTGNIGALSSNEQKAAMSFRKLFDDSLQYVNELVRAKDPTISPLSIPKRENYVPHLLKSSPELVAAVEKKVQQLEQAAGKPLQSLDPREFKAVMNTPEGQELLQGMKIFDAKQIKGGKELAARIQDTFESRSGRIRMDTEARAALERSGDIPLFMRETNLYRLADRWSTNTLRHLYLRKTTDELGSIARRLEKAGATLESKYIEHLLQDINGIRKGTMAELTRQVNTKWVTALEHAADRATTPASKAVLTAAKVLPELVSDLGRQIYPNLLGLNPKAMIQNAMQPFLKTAPELGTKYGPGVVLRATLHALGNLPSQIERVNRMGLAPAEFTAKYRQAVSDGIRRNSLYAIPSQTLDKLGNASLFLYSKLDTLNRAITLSVSDIMAHDLAAGNKWAQQSLKKFPDALQRQIAGAESQREVGALLSQHLNASTQYNYNRASMSEFGRTMGPLFSIFSKWPTATAGEIVQEFRSGGALKGSLRNAEKYLVPLMMLKVADSAMSGGEGAKEGFSDRQKKLFGGTGLAQAAPLGSLEGMLKGDFFTPPAIDALMKGVIGPAMSGDPDKFQKGLANSIQQWTPGSVYVRFLTDDLVTYLTGRRPEGADFIERTGEGIRQLSR